MAFLLHAPGPTDGIIILTFGIMMGFEFILAHSGVFMAALPRRISLMLLVPLYGLIALAMNNIVPGNAVLWLYMVVIFTRMRFAFSKPSPEANKANVLFSVAAVITYFILIFTFAFSSNLLPQFGITETYLQSIEYAELHDSKGLFVDAPGVALSMGVVYFMLLAVYEWAIYVLPKPQRFNAAM